MPLSPMMEQYVKTKNENPDALLFYRLGDFYEMFFEDAKIAARELDLVLTGRDCGLAERAPMCGVPFHSADTYIARLVQKGYKVAVCEQMEDPATAKGLVKREIVRIATPGTAIDFALLDESKNNYLGVIIKVNDATGLCFSDVSTGEVHLCRYSEKEQLEKCIEEIARFKPSEIICSENIASERLFQSYITVNPGLSVNKIQAENCNIEKYTAVIEEHFKRNVGELQLTSDELVCALGETIVYLRDVQRNDLKNITEIDLFNNSLYMSLGTETRRNLELTESRTLQGTKGTLLGVLDKTKTAMGKRMLRSWTELPLMSITEIYSRQNAVSEIYSDMVLRTSLTELLSGVNDFERILTRVVYGTANAKELRTLAQSFAKLPEIKSTLQNAKSKKLSEIYREIDTLSDACKLIDEAITDDPPLTVREGGMIKKGYNHELDELNEIVSGGKNYLAKIEEQEKEKTGIKKLKIGYNRVFGYYIEVTNSFKELVPDNYIRKQTLANAERYITEELKDLESKVLGAQERTVRLEFELFSAVREKIADMQFRIKTTAQAVATLDALLSLASVAVENGYTCPVVDSGDEIIIHGGFHPVVAKILDSLTPFVPNDTRLDCKNDKLAIITGPNMAGKSTYMRQIALIVIMAQMGSFVPAKDARIGIVDAVFTRIGAADDLMTGQSTFMTEMNEVSGILKNATEKSLIILDEVGRGTSTFDGMSIAEAVLEYIASKTGAKTLFATHYHELTALEGQIKGVKNYNIAVKKRKDEIIFLRKIMPGGADGSYGIDVARLAGLPQEVIKRAKAIQRELESTDLTHREINVQANAEIEDEITIESLGKEDIFREIRLLDLNTMSPIHALTALAEIKEKVERL